MANTPSTGLRHATRALHKTCYDHIAQALEELKWTTTGLFKQPPVKLLENLPKYWSEDAKLVTGQAAVSIGNEDAPVLQEMGGPLYESYVPLYVDVYFDDEPIALAFANDVRDILVGRFAGFAATQKLPVYDYSVNPPVAAEGFYVWFEDPQVNRERYGWYSVTCGLRFGYSDPDH